MMEHYPLEVIRDHLVLVLPQGRAILDTGSPFDIGRGGTLTLLGRTRTPESDMQWVLDAASSFLGTKIEFLCGYQTLAEHGVIVDWDARVATFVARPLQLESASMLPMRLMLGVPLVQVTYGGLERRAVLDSGASLSYIPEDIARPLEAAGTRTDFYPIYGEFDTDVFRVPVRIGGRELTLEAGVLPPLLAASLSVIGDGWIVGSDFFRGRSIGIDYPWAILDAPGSGSGA